MFSYVRLHTTLGLRIYIGHKRRIKAKTKSSKIIKFVEIEKANEDTY